MNTLLSVNLTTRTALEGSTPWQTPLLTYGETLTVGLRLQRNVEGVTVDTREVVLSLKAGIGEIDQRPAGGTWALSIGDGAATSALSALVSASAMALAINALTSVVAAHGPATVEERDGSWLIIFGEGAEEVALAASANRLWPVALVRLSAYVVDGRWIHEVRLVQVPVAFTSASERVLPPAPSIARVREGGSDGLIVWNEVQALAVPAGWRGTYYTISNKQADNSVGM